MKTNTALNEKLASVCATGSLPCCSVIFLDAPLFFFFLYFNCKLITDLDISLLCINTVDINNNIALQAFGMRKTFLCTKWPVLTSGIARCKLYCSVQISSISLTASPIIDGLNYNKVQFLRMIYVTTCYAGYCIALKLHYSLPTPIRSFF